MNNSLTLKLSIILLGISQIACVKIHTDTYKKQSPTNIVRIATEGAYPPMNFTNPDGTLGGFDVDIADALCKQMKVQCEIVTQEWDGIIPGLIAKKYDVIIAGMSITEERQTYVDFSDPYFSSDFVLIAKESSNIKFETLTGKKIGVQKSTHAASYIKKNYPETEIKFYDRQDGVNVDLIKGNLDGLVVDQIIGVDWLHSSAAQGFAQKATKLPVNPVNMSIATRKGEPLKGQFNKALFEIRKNGTYQVIHDKYFQ